MIGILLHAEEFKANSQRGIWLHSHGLQTTFQRISTRKQTPTPPLFGTTALTFSSKKDAGDAQFIAEWECLRERNGLGRPYSRLKAASYYAEFLRENAGIFPDPGPSFELATVVFDSLESAQKPLTVIFKALYKTALMEGLPVKEDWLYRESKDVFHTARDILKNPVNSPILRSVSESRIRLLTEKLQSWLTHHTEFRLPSARISLS